MLRSLGLPVLTWRQVAKTRLQAQGEGGGSGPKRGLFSTLAHIRHQEGLSRLYYGLSAACARQIVYSGSRIVIYEQLRENILGRDDDGHFALWKGVVAGLGAGFLGQLIASPTDLVKVQMQLDGRRLAAGQQPRYSSSAQAARVLLAEGGARGMWRGWGPNCSRAALVQLGDLTTYDAAKQFLIQNGVPDGPILHASSSGMAGLVAATFGAPADLVKTRFMNQPLGSDGHGQLYRTPLQCLTVTVRQEGLGALFKGWLPTWLRMAPWSLTFFLTFEQLRKATGQSSF